MTHRGPFQHLPFCDSFCDSVISILTDLRWAKYLNKHAVSEPMTSLTSKFSTESGKGAGKYDITSLGCPWSAGVKAEH